VIGTNAVAVLGDALALAAAVDEPAAALVPTVVLAVAVVPWVALVPVDELPVLQPASRPIPIADAAVSASFAPVVACLPLFIGHPRCPMSLPLVQAAGVP
jgi:hypothetical protein